MTGSATTSKLPHAPSTTSVLPAIDEDLPRALPVTAQALPAIVLHGNEDSDPSSTAQTSPARLLEAPDDAFHGLDTDIESGELEDIFAADQVSFSKRGSILWSKDKSSNFRMDRVAQYNTVQADHATKRAEGKILNQADYLPATTMTAEDRRLSKRVRSMYEYGDDSILQLPTVASHPQESIVGETIVDHVAHNTGLTESLPRHESGGELSSTSTDPQLRRVSYLKSQPWEMAGGIENWQDIAMGAVDRYGFINTRQLESRGSSRLSTVIPSTVQAAQPENLSPIVEGPQPYNHREPGTPKSSDLARATSTSQTTRRVVTPSRAGRFLSPSVRSGHTSTSTNSKYKRRSFGRHGRHLAEASSMLDLDSSTHFRTHESQMTEPQTVAMKASKERKREMKWFKMASALAPRNSESRNGDHVIGAGATEYSFDTSNPKLVSRTWKGIPDRWRAAAWRSFLLSSSDRRLGASGPSDATLVAEFHALQERDCADDVQIDMDVPRTIAGHIMFRSRYRGGQRLMFRVLHALALRFPDTGYVQGMAPLAATLLCYYDEELAFAMAARMWLLRGLQYLYSPGFQGLITSLRELEVHWLGKGDIKQSLDALGIDAMSYATKWYLTLFNHTLPFAAQLRVWDVFMLLGDPSTNSSNVDAAGLTPNLSVLHAVAAALMDGMHDVLVGAEFENAMSVLTSSHTFVVDDALLNIAHKKHRRHM